MKYTVLLVGAGRLGSRYLQGIAGARNQLSITVVDSSSSALDTAKARWAEVDGERSHHELSWANAIPVDLRHIDLALLVTSASGRANLVQHIASQSIVRYWVLEKVLAQSVDEVEIIKRALVLSEGAWVNTSRRMMAWHKSLKNRFQTEGPIDVAYAGGLWGLACNSIHFIDLIAWWMDEKLKSVDPSGLDSDWFESKRADYFEVTGELHAHFSGGSTLALASRDQADSQKLRIDLADETVWTIDEVSGVAVSTNGERIDGSIEFQKQLSESLVDDILLRGQCDLPTLNESSAMHSVFLEAMLSHWNRSRNRNDLSVPIT